MRNLLLLLLILLATGPVQAEVYKWVDEKGVVHYTDEPPTRNAKPAELPKLQTYKQGTLPSLEKFEEPAGAPAAAAAAAPSVRILSPTPEQTFRGAQTSVPVSVQITPALGAGQLLVYHVDGTPHSAPTPSTAYSVTGLERGAHTISVALVNEAGGELARSAPVNVHVKPPIAR